MVSHFLCRLAVIEKQNQQIEREIADVKSRMNKDELDREALREAQRRAAIRPPNGHRRIPGTSPVFVDCVRGPSECLA